MNAFQGLINQATSLEVPPTNEILELLLLGSLPNSWETLVVTLDNEEGTGVKVPRTGTNREQDRGQGVAYVLLLWEVEALTKELLTLPERERDQWCGFVEEFSPKWF